MTPATTKTALIFLCSVNVLLCWTTAQLEVANITECQSSNQTFENLSAYLKEAVQCAGNLTPNQTAALLGSVRTLTDILKTRQKTACPSVAAHRKGGLVCGSVVKAVYCKPMCNEGYDFAFLRRSRLYEECSEDTKYKWTTQYVGGNKLAVCQKSSSTIAGGVTTYFPKGQDCLMTKSNTELESAIIQQFTNELKSQGIVGQLEHTVLICG